MSRIDKRLVLGLGSNQGNSLLFLHQAKYWISLHIGHIERESSYYKTAAWGLENQPDFINQTLSVFTPFTPEYCLQKCLYIEKLLGRFRTQKWGPRTIDIDILFFDNCIHKSPSLEIPHPHLHNRNFVMQPLVEILPTMQHPKLRKPLSLLYQECSDNLPTRKIFPQIFDSPNG